MFSTARKLRGGFLGIGASLSLGALALLGCGDEKSETPAAASAPAATPGQPAAPPAVLADAWSSTLPSDFPPDVPIYPAAAVVKAQETPESGLRVAWSTADDLAKVASFYNDSLAAQGWSTQRVDGNDGTLVFADKGARSLTFGIASNTGKTQIDLLLVEMR